MSFPSLQHSVSFSVIIFWFILEQMHESKFATRIGFGGIYVHLLIKLSGLSTSFQLNLLLSGLIICGNKLNSYLVSKELEEPKPFPDMLLIIFSFYKQNSFK